MWMIGAKKKKEEKIQTKTYVLAGDKAQIATFCMYERESNMQFRRALANGSKAQFLQKVGHPLSSPGGASFEIRPTAQGTTASRKNKPQKT